MTFRYRTLHQPPLAFATTLIFVFTILLPQISYAVSVQSSRLPHPFQFTENKGQWDSAVVYKCEVRRDGFTWFLERDGVTLVTSVIDSSSVIAKAPNGACGNPLFSTFPNTQSLPPNSYSIGGACLRACDPLVSGKFPLKSHALKFKFVASCRCEERSEGSSAVGGKPQRSDEAIYSFKDSMIQEEITFGEPFGVASSFHFGSASHVPTFIPRKYKIRIQDTRLGRMQYASAKWINAQGELSWHNNYFLGNDSTKWAPDCRNFTRVVYHDVWDGIDVEWYESKGHLEFDFVVHPGADPKQIKMVCEGLTEDLSFVGGAGLRACERRGESHSPLSVKDAQKEKTEIASSFHFGSASHVPTFHSSQRQIKIQNAGSEACATKTELVLPTSLGELRMKIPEANQTTVNGARGTDVTAQFRLVSENLFAIDLPNGYDPSQTLRIDPLVYSTYLGGGGNDYGDGIANDGSGGVIICGCTNSYDFPITAGAIDGSYNGASVSTGDCFVTRVDSTFSRLIYSTFLGGPDDDRAESIVSDSLGNSTITGYSGSQFPTTAGAFDRSYNGDERDCFIARLNSSGERLLYSTYIGGNGYDDGHSILSGDSGSVFIGGITNSLNFPTTPGVFDSAEIGGVLIHLNNSGSGLLYSTVISPMTNSYSITPDGSGGIISTGYCHSGLPTTPNAFDTTFNGGDLDAFVLRLNSTGSQLLYSTYLGGSGNQEIAGSIVSDENGNCVITGNTTSLNFSVTAGAYNTAYNGGGTVLGDCFISYLDSTGSNLLYSTYLGGSGEDIGRSILYYSDTSVIVVGATYSTNFPTTFGAYSHHLNGTVNCFIAKFKINTSQLIYSTYFGGTGTTGGFASIRHHSDEIIFTGICGPGFPTTPEVGDTSFNGVTDGFIARLTLFPDSSASTPERFIQPSDFALAQNYPNPFNATTTLSYSLPTTSHVDLRLYDLTGREITTLVQHEQRAGTYRVLLDGSRLASGTYFVRLQAGTFSKTQKIVLLK